MEAVAGGVPILILPWLLFSWTASPCKGPHCSHQYKEVQQRDGNLSNRLPLWDNASGYQLMQGCCQVLPQPPKAKCTITGTVENNGSPRPCLSSSDLIGHHSEDVPDPPGFQVSSAYICYYQRVCEMFVCSKGWMQKGQGGLQQQQICQGLEDSIPNPNPTW